MENRVMYFKNKADANKWFWRLSCAMRKMNSRIKSVTMDYSVDKGCYEVEWSKVVR